jgi:PKD repeat protein
VVIQTIHSKTSDFAVKADGTKQNPVHKYDRAGKYTVTLLVKNYGGFDTKIVKNYISVNKK